MNLTASCEKNSDDYEPDLILDFSSWSSLLQWFTFVNCKGLVMSVICIRVSGWDSRIGGVV